MFASALYSGLFVAFSLAAAFLVAGLSARIAGERMDLRYVSYGMGMFFLGIALHSLIAFPVVLIAEGPQAVLHPARAGAGTFEPWQLVWFALAAGVGQEVVKALPISLERKRPTSDVHTRNAAWLGLLIGLGFSTSEVILIATSSWRPVMHGLGISNVFIGALERTSASLFHMGTAAWIGSAVVHGGLRTALAVCIALHAGLDALAGLLHIQGTRATLIEEAALFAFSAVFFLIVFRRQWRQRAPAL